MKKLIIILALIFTIIGCATQKEAINKGYLHFDKKEAILSGILILATGSTWGASDGWKWNMNLMVINYPECFKDMPPSAYGGLMCVQDKVREEGGWREYRKIERSETEPEFENLIRPYMED